MIVPAAKDLLSRIYRDMIPAIVAAIHKLKNHKVAEISIVPIVVTIVLRTKVQAILPIGMMIYFEAEIVFVVAVIPQLALCDEECDTRLETRRAYGCRAVTSRRIIAQQPDLYIRMKEQRKAETTFDCLCPLATYRNRCIDLGLHEERLRGKFFFIGPYFIILTIRR